MIIVKRSIIFHFQFFINIFQLLDNNLLFHILFIQFHVVFKHMHWFGIIFKIGFDTNIRYFVVRYLANLLLLLLCLLFTLFIVFVLVDHLQQL